MVYLVKEGEFEETRLTKISARKNHLDDFTTRTLIGPKSNDVDNLKKQENINRMNLLQAKKVKTQNVKLCYLCMGHMFGEADVTNLRAYTTSVKCISSSAIVYCIKSEVFLIKFGKDDKTWKLLIDRILRRDHQIKQKIKAVIKRTMYN